MKKSIVLILALALGACQPEAKYKLLSLEETFLDDEACLVQLEYPQIRGLADSMSSSGINQYLRTALHLERELKSCLSPENEGRKVVLGSYKSYLITDSLMSVELVKELQSGAAGKRYKQYYPITISLPEMYNPPINFLLGDEIFDKLRVKLSDWAADDSSRRFNVEAYQAGSTYALAFCLSADSLILYPGAEGEYLANHRLALSLKDLQ